MVHIIQYIFHGEFIFTNIIKPKWLRELLLIFIHLDINIFSHFHFKQIICLKPVIIIRFVNLIFHLIISLCTCIPT